MNKALQDHTPRENNFGNKRLITRIDLKSPSTNRIDTESDSNNKQIKYDSRFLVTDTDVYHLHNDEQYWLCSKLEVIALARDQSSENWGRLLVIEDADKQLHQWAMPMEMLKGGGDEMRGELLRLGLIIAPGAKNRNLLAEYIVTAKPVARACCVNRTGWYKSVFVLPNKTIGELDDQILFQSDHAPKNYQEAGNLEQWQQHIARYCVGNSRLVFAISSAFASMLLYLTDAESGGIHFVGESSTGKTTALRVAASVFGPPNYLNRWRATTNGIEALAAMHSDTLGEVGLSQHMMECGKKSKAGQEVRLVDIPADAGANLGIFEQLHELESGAVLSKHLVVAATKYYGVAATTFLETITKSKNLAHLPNEIKLLCQRFIQENLPTDASGQVHRVCERFALIATAGELASHYKITGWQTGEAKRAATKCFEAWLEQRGSTSNKEKPNILSKIKAFFETHGESRFSDWFDDHSRTINRAGFKKRESEGMRFYVLPECFRHEICEGIDHRSAAKILATEGWLQVDASGTAYRREYLPNIGRSRCYVFTNRMWEE